jgi:hypothetical protein
MGMLRAAENLHRFLGARDYGASARNRRDVRRGRIQRTGVSTRFTQTDVQVILVRCGTSMTFL